MGLHAAYLFMELKRCDWFLQSVHRHWAMLVAWSFSYYRWPWRRGGGVQVGRVATFKTSGAAAQQGGVAIGGAEHLENEGLLPGDNLGPKEDTRPQARDRPVWRALVPAGNGVH